MRADRWDRPTDLVLDIDPPSSDAFALAVEAARLVHQVLIEAGLAATVQTSAAKGLHVFVPLDASTTIDDAAAVTRAIAARAERLDPALATTAFLKEERGGRVFVDSSRAGGGTLVAAYSPRVRPGTPISFPVAWEDLDRVAPNDFTLCTVPSLLGATDPWRQLMPAPSLLSPALVEEGRAIPVARVQAMHADLRRMRAQGRRSKPAGR